MSEQDEDKFWSEVGKASTPRRSEFRWTALRARIMSRVLGASTGWLRPLIAAAVAAALVVGWIEIPSLRTAGPVETSVVAWEARVATSDGLVLVFSQGSGEGVPAVAGMPLQDGDQVQVGADGKAELALSEDAVVSLGPDTRMTVADLQQAHTFLDLSVGSLVAKLDWPKTPGRRLAVRSPTAVAAVRGTEFGVVVAADGETSVGVFDHGAVAVTANDAPSVAETLLAPHEEVRVPRNAAAEVVTRDGRAYLRSRPLDTLKPFQGRVESLRGRQEILRREWKSLPPSTRESPRAGIMRGRERTLSAPPPNDRKAARRNDQTIAPTRREEFRGQTGRARGGPPSGGRSGETRPGAGRPRPSPPGENRPRGTRPGDGRREDPRQKK